MSATHDKSQKTTFVYSNLYQIYKKGKDAAMKADVTSAAPFAIPSEKNVLKAGNVAQPESAGPEVKISAYTPIDLIGKRVARPESISSNSAINSLKDNLKNLNDLHARLKFMLQELEELVRK